MLIFNVHCKCNTSAKLLFPSHSVDADTEAINQSKFIVLYSMLLALFKMFCFVCKSPNPAVDMWQQMGPWSLLLKTVDLVDQ